jgi:hypothetical protein
MRFWENRCNSSIRVVSEYAVHREESRKALLIDCAGASTNADDATTHDSNTAHLLCSQQIGHATIWSLAP